MLGNGFYSFVTETGELIHVVKNERWYRPDDPEGYRSELEQDELQWQSETFRCNGCHREIMRRHTYWFLSWTRFGEKYTSVPERIKNGVDCPECLDARMLAYSRVCENCGNPYYASSHSIDTPLAKAEGILPTQPAQPVRRD